METFPTVSVSLGTALPGFKPQLSHPLALSPITSQCLSVLIHEGRNLNTPHRAAVWLIHVHVHGMHSHATSYYLSNPELGFILNLEFKLVSVQILYEEGFFFSFLFPA